MYIIINELNYCPKNTETVEKREPARETKFNIRKQRKIKYKYIDTQTGMDDSCGLTQKYNADRANKYD